MNQEEAGVPGLEIELLEKDLMDKPAREAASKMAGSALEKMGKPAIEPLTQALGAGV